MDSAFIERKFFINDVIVINYKETPFRIIVKQTDAEKVFLELPSGETELANSKEMLADLDGDGNSDIRISVREIDNVGKGAVLKFDRNTDAPSVASSIISSEEELSNVSAAATETVASITAPPAGTTAIQARRQTETVIYEGTVQQPFVVNIAFKGYCLMRYEADDKQREERYFNKGEIFRLDVTKSIKIWLSNAAAVTATVNNVEYDFGKNGSVASKLIAWNSKPEGGYVVKSTPLY
jgi:hypothetical protein